MRFARILILAILLVLSVGCDDNSDEFAVLYDIESYLDHSPDSALAYLRSFNLDSLDSRYLKARYALLHSIALDKNFIDLTTDSIISPAVSYFAYKGSIDDRFKTLYYLGRIRQNAGLNEEAMELFVSASSMGDKVTDKAALARCWSAQGMIYAHLYDFEKAIDAYSKSSALFLEVGNINSYVNDCLKILDAYWCLGEYEKVRNALDELGFYLDEVGSVVLSYYYSVKIRYECDTSPICELLETVQEYTRTLPYRKVHWNTVAKAYIKAGLLHEAEEAMRLFAIYDRNKMNSAAYHSTMAIIYETSNNYKLALDEYKAYIHISDSVDLQQYAQDTKFIQERYDKDIDILRSRNRVLVSMIVIITLCLFLSISVYKILCQNRKRKILQGLIADIEAERNALSEMINSMPINDPQILKLLSDRMDLLNDIVLQQRLPYSGNVSRTNDKIRALLDDTKEYLATISLSFMVRNPMFITYLKSKGLLAWEIGYCCLYIMGYNAKEISGIMNNSQVYKVSSEIRRKLGINDGKSRLESILKSIYDQNMVSDSQCYS